MSDTALSTTTDPSTAPAIGGNPPFPGDVPLERIRDELLPLYREPFRSPKTRTMMAHIFRVLDDLDVKRASDLTVEMIARLVESMPKEASCRTKVQRLRCVRIVANFCVIRGYLPVSPFDYRSVGSWVRITPVRRKRYYTPDEVRRLLSLMKADSESPEATGWQLWKARRLYAVTATLAYTGLRPGEAFHLHAADIDLSTSLIAVVPRVRLKTEESARDVAIAPDLKPILEFWLHHRTDAPPGKIAENAQQCPWAFPGVTRRNYWHSGPMGHRPIDVIKRVAERAGIEGATFAKFRHTWATQADSLGIHGNGIAKVLGHTSVATSEKFYRHRDQGNTAAVMQKFSYAR